MELHHRRVESDGELQSNGKSQGRIPLTVPSVWLHCALTLCSSRVSPVHLSARRRTCRTRSAIIARRRKFPPKYAAHTRCHNSEDKKLPMKIRTSNCTTWIMIIGMFLAGLISPAAAPAAGQVVHRPLSDFLSTQGTYCIGVPSSCFLFVPPDRNFVGWSTNFGKSPVLFAGVDYAGLVRLIRRRRSDVHGKHHRAPTGRWPRRGEGVPSD